MEKGGIFLTIVFLLCSYGLYAQSTDRLSVEEVIVNSYIHGLIDAEDFKIARKGIHEGFVILGHRGALLTKKTRDQWIEQRKKLGKLPKVSYTILYIDIEGNAASAKLELKREKLIAIDYLFLYKFDNGWKVVSAIDHAKSNGKN